MIRIGIVTAAYPERVTARVTFDDLGDGENGGLVSAELPVLQNGSLGDCGYWMPRVGAQVYVAMAGNAPECGCILGTVYNDEDAAPKTGAGIWYQRFADGSVIEYDPGAGFTIQSDKPITIKGSTVHINP